MLVLGTAWIDPARLVLLLVPGSFLVMAFGAGALVGRACGCLWPWLDQGSEAQPVASVAVPLGVGIACLSLLAWITAFCGVLWVAGLLAIPLLVYGLRMMIHPGLVSLARRLSFGFRLDRSVRTGILGGAVVGGGWLIAWLWGTISPHLF